ncbi:hypothetical protein OESDEN_12418 [Oesophagostomum dentatum]|uniref:Uncharacterized protein n=1 Tax=Oesophagostomum dentatum TaxID=61180 RepID=A0A0B1SS63_OESDE|nr:hypothetical protein OESDEN_12418 [Oesophagostomum dentatum]
MRLKSIVNLVRRQSYEWATHCRFVDSMLSSSIAWMLGEAASSKSKSFLEQEPISVFSCEITSFVSLRQVHQCFSLLGLCSARD